MDTRRKIGWVIVAVFAVIFIFILANNSGATFKKTAVVSQYYTDPMPIMSNGNFVDVCNINYPNYYGGVGSQGCLKNYQQASMYYQFTQPVYTPYYNQYNQQASMYYQFYQPGAYYYGPGYYYNY